MANSATWRLAGSALASTVVYATAFRLPYGLAELAGRPHQNIAKVAADDPRAAVGYLMAFGVLFVAYWLAHRAARGGGLAAWLVVVAGTLAINAVMVGMYPVGAADIFDNIARGRLAALHGANPFVSRPADFPGDPFFAYVAWPYATSAYGPLWELLAAPVAGWAGNEVMANVVAFKLVSVAAYSLTAAVIGLAWSRRDPPGALPAVILFAWNPLVVYSVAGNGHNDSLVALSVALGLYWLAVKRPLLAAGALLAGALVKFIPVLLLPLVVAFALRGATGWPERLRYAGAVVVLGVGLVAAAYAPFWQGGAGLDLAETLAWRQSLFTTSLPTLARLALAPGLGEESAQGLAAKGALALLAGFVAWQTRRVWVGRGAEEAPRAALAVLLFYLLVSCTWFQPWYAVWPLAAAALLPGGRWWRVTLVLSYAVTLKMPLLDFWLSGGGYLPPVEEREWRLWLGTLGLPWAYAVWSLWQGRPGTRTVVVRE